MLGVLEDWLRLGLLILTLDAIITDGGVAQTCADRADCEYPECLQWINHGTTEVACGSEAHGTVCVQAQTYDYTGDWIFWVPCAPGPCVAGKYKFQMSPNDFCEWCSTGKYSSSWSNSTTCSDCVAGKYTNQLMSTSCMGCQAGTYQSLMKQRRCLACEAGTFQQWEGMSTCQKCSNGTYQNLQGQTGCDACPTGTFTQEVGANSSETCKLCVPGSYQPVNASSGCPHCPSGTFQSLQGQTGCDVCPPGTYTQEVGSNSSKSCKVCPPGTYQPANGSSDCLKCPSGTNSSLGGQTNLSGCGERLCPPGTYQPEQSKTACLDCSTGTYNTGSGGRGLLDCLRCAKGSYSSTPGASGCQSCSPGMYSQEVGLDSLTSCLLCPAGTYSTTLFATSDGVCLRCSAGSYSTKADNTCVSCQPGKYAQSEGRTRCENCTKKPPPTTASENWYTNQACSIFQDGTWKQCTKCAGSTPVTARNCTDTMDTECSAASLCTREVPTKQPEYTEWMSAEYKCKPGQYLRGFKTETDKDCRQCPPGMIGRNGVYCEWCEGPLEEPYWLDGASCVCKPPAVLNASEVCVCPDGYGLAGQACVPCERNTYGSGGQCWPCGAGNTTDGMMGMTRCTACEYGKYRLSGQEECQGCSKPGWYAPDPSVGVCLQCNTSCTGMPGWRTKGSCPSGDTTGIYRLCEPCPGDGLPPNAVWLPPESDLFFQECAFKCKDSYFHKEMQCVPCSNATSCEDLSYKLTPCSPLADSHCEIPCKNDTKAPFNSKWLPGCQWGCEDGYELAVGDYWMFVLYECRPSLN